VMKRLFAFLMFVLCIPFCFAVEGHMHLLAAREYNDSYEGSPADLYLEIVPGKGRVFMETFPIAKVDTQLSARFAKEVACRYVDVDCSRYDFFYRITSDTNVIGGPSAGASISALTAALLKGYGVNGSVAITGTINSGGFVGRVGAVKSKIDAARMSGVSVVLIPKGSMIFREEAFLINVSKNGTISEEDNSTFLNLSEYASKYNISVFEVSTLDDAMFYVSGKRNDVNYSFSVDKSYGDIMKGLAVDLCSRSKELSLKYDLSKISGTNYSFNVSQIYNETVNASSRAKKAFDSGDYYSAASFCYANNVKHKFLFFLQQNYSSDEIRTLVSSTDSQILKYESLTSNKSYKTITDLQTAMIVEDRLYDAKKYLNDSFDDLNGSVDMSLYSLASSIERLYTVSSWSSFFGSGKAEFVLSDEKLKDACILEYSEAQERFEYGKAVFPLSMIQLNDEFSELGDIVDSGKYSLCLLRASELKANVEAFMSVVDVNESELKDLVDVKLSAVENSLGRQSKNGVFPILGYSYYVYAKSLNEYDSAAALIYSEYALELSNIDIYFEPKKELDIDPEVFNKALFVLSGFCLGLFVAYLYFSWHMRKVRDVLAEKPKKRNKKK